MTTESPSLHALLTIGLALIYNAAATRIFLPYAIDARAANCISQSL
jgi:hypothetical protein